MKFRKLKDFLKSKHAKAVVAASIAVTSLMAVASAADTPPDTATSIQTSLSSIQGTVLTVLAAAAGLGIVIFGFFLAWHYGKRIFKTVAK